MAVVRRRSAPVARFVLTSAWCQETSQRFWCVVDTTIKRWAAGADPGGYLDKAEAEAVLQKLAG